jgi:hypothetical protein
MKWPERIEGVLLVDYRTGKLRLLKSLKKDKNGYWKMNPAEVAIKLSINMKTPPQPVMEMTGEIEISRAKEAQIMLEALKEGDEPTDGQTK